MIRFACPKCNSVLNAPDGKAGRELSCPKCGQWLQVPGQTVRPERNTSPPAESQESSHPAQHERKAAVDSDPEEPEQVREDNAQQTRRPRRGRPVDSMSDGSSRSGFHVFGTILLCFGSFLLCIGSLVTFFYWLIFSTTVTSFDGSQIHNTGLQNDRIVGAKVGVGLSLVGVGLCIGGAVFLSARRN